MNEIHPTPQRRTERRTPEEPAADAATVDAATADGPRVWRSLEELAHEAEAIADPGAEAARSAGSSSFAEKLQREFPRQAAELGNVDRRRFLQLTGASLGLAGLAACTKQPPEKIVPYVRQPEDIVPGKPLFYATALDRAGYALPVLAESHMGRPTKVEGNPEHPASRGATDAVAQASILDLYDPDRSQAITHIERIRSWAAFVQQVESLRTALLPMEGSGLRILSGAVTSPTVSRLLDRVLEEMPQARWHRHEPLAQGDALRRATGARIALRHDLTKADVVVAVESDFLHDGPAAVRHAKDFASRRKSHGVDDTRQMSRLYTVESVPTGTSTVADHRLALPPAKVAGFVAALAAELGVPGATAPSGSMDERETAWVEELAADLRAHAGSSAILVGEQADPDLHAAALAINQHLGNVGDDGPVQVTAPVEKLPEDDAGLAELVEDIEAGDVSTLLVLDSNPVFTSPGDVDFAAAMDKVALRIHVGAFTDETGERCHWHVPLSHTLESWGDLRTADGTAAIVQPIVRALYDTHTVPEVLAAFAGLGASDPEALVRETWSDADKKSWRRWLHDGWVEDDVEAAGPAAPAVPPTNGAFGRLAERAASAPDFTLLFRPDPTVLDGRHANNAWLQETPKPVTKLTWDNALLVSPRTATERGWGDLLHEGEQRPRSPMVQVKVGERSVDVPVWVVPGIADGTGLLHVGYGRRRSGNVADGTGFDVNTVMDSESHWRVDDPQLARTGENYDLACTQDHHSMEGRAPIRTTNVPTWEAHPDDPLGIHLHVDPSKSMMPSDQHLTGEYQWGMTIDLTSCTGCNACLTACVAENNIPAIGKDQVKRGREMHWIRVDRYFVGDDPNDVEMVANQPVPCMQCEQAPCEVVCPVAATVHSDEGLNDMIYNRCVGTRYCSNNCPYKVRRFNFLLYQDFDTPQLKLGRNPDVTVRSRGVMEKCTYCVQRINQSRIEARREGRKIPRDSVVTACQQACPSDAIVFGDIADEESAVSHSKRSALDYSLLAELGTRPRTTYLGRVTNPNPRLWERLHPERPLVAERHHGSDDHGGDHGEEHSDEHGAEAAH